MDATLDDDGFYFISGSEQGDLDTSEYGTTFTSCRFVIEQLERLENCEVRIFRAGFWYGHQDLYVVTKVASSTKIPIADDCVYSNDERTDGAVDNVFITEKMFSGQKRRILHITGWAAPDLKGDKCADAILVLFRTNAGAIHSCEATRRRRPDVASAFGNPALLETGFSADVEIANLDGDSTLLLATKSGNELKLCRTISIPLQSIGRRPS